jgi:hypothetical protein
MTSFGFSFGARNGQGWYGNLENTAIVLFAGFLRRGLL